MIDSPIAIDCLTFLIFSICVLALGILLTRYIIPLLDACCMDIANAVVIQLFLMRSP